MKQCLQALVICLLFSALALPGLSGEPSGRNLEELVEKVRQLDQRVQALETLAGTPKAEPPAQTAGLRERAQKRFEQDRATYSHEERREIESLYQVANKQWNSPEAQESLKKLIEKYTKASRTGCALLYLGQMSSGEDKEKYLKKAMNEFPDCYYGNGVQVGAYARFQLAYYYQDLGRKEEAAALFEEIRKEYPDAVNHKGRLLSEIMPR